MSQDNTNESINEYKDDQTMDDDDINESEDFVVDKENLEQYISPAKAYRYCNIVTFLCFIGCYLLD